MLNEPNPIYHCCRWCKWFNSNDSVCKNDRAFDVGDDIDFTKFCEDGYLAEAIREGLNERKFKHLEYALTDSKLSKKRITEIMKVFSGEMDDAFINWTESIDDSVSTAINHFDFDYSDGTKIKEPNEFYCKYFC